MRSVRGMRSQDGTPVHVHLLTHTKEQSHGTSREALPGVGVQPHKAPKEGMINTLGLFASRSSGCCHNAHSRQHPVWAPPHAQLPEWDLQKIMCVAGTVLGRYEFKHSRAPAHTLAPTAVSHEARLLPLFFTPACLLHHRMKNEWLTPPCHKTKQSVGWDTFDNTSRSHLLPISHEYTLCRGSLILCIEPNFVCLM